MAEHRTLRSRPTLFRKTDDGVPELEPPDSQTSGQPSAPPVKPSRVKATFYLNPDDIIAIDTMQTAEFRRTGKKPERSELVSRAIQELFGQQDG
jgi:hypothetical protein